MTITTPSRAPARAAAPSSLTNAVRALGGRRILLTILAAALIGAGLFFNWSWLVAAGIAPLLLSVLPCVAMCALGLCMMGMAGKKGSSADPSGGGPAANQADSSSIDASRQNERS